MQHSSNKSVRIIIVLIILLLRKESYGFILQPFETLRLSSQPSLYLSASSACCILENEFGTSETITSTLTSHLNLATFSKEELLSQNDCVYTHFLTWVPYQYDQLQDYALAIATLDRSGKNNKPKMNMNPFFSIGETSFGESGRDLLIKAVGLPNRCMSDVTIYDLTAGFGQDSLLMAKSGAGKVYMVERNPVLTCLLKDALRRLVVLTEANCIRDPIRREASDLADRLHLIHDDGLNVANALLTADIESRPEIIYLDPMFPERKKSASVKKNMQILHGLLGSQDVELDERLKQEQDLLLLSLEATRQRVVVKRPKNAPTLGRESSSAPSYATPNPMYALDGPVSRWDVYAK